MFSDDGDHVNGFQERPASRIVRHGARLLQPVVFLVHHRDDARVRSRALLHQGKTAFTMSDCYSLFLENRFTLTDTKDNKSVKKLSISKSYSVNWTYIFQT